MPGNKGVGTIVGGAGGGAAMSAQDAACKAFGQAVKTYCGTKPGDRDGTFVDFFFQTLSKTKPVGSELAASIAGDSSVTAAQASTSIASAIASSSSGKSSDAAKRILATNAAVPGMDPSPSLSAWAKLGSPFLGKESPANPAPAFPVGTLNNAAIEVKAPTDTYEPGKLEEFQHVSRDTAVIEVGCEACGEDCGKGNTC